MSATKRPQAPDEGQVNHSAAAAEFGTNIRLSEGFETTLRSRSKHRRAKLAKADTRSMPHATRNDIFPKLEIVHSVPEALSMPARNVRGVEETHVHEVMSSICTLGFCSPVLIDDDSRVLDGVVRVLAAMRLNLASVPCVRVSQLTALERRLLRLALNRLNEKGCWAFDDLKVELKELALECAPIEITGFSLSDIDQISLDEEPNPLETGPLAPAQEAVPVAQRGDVFLLGEHMVTCGDSTDPQVLRKIMSDTQARIILTDQPYNVPIAGHVTKSKHREFVMASGEMNHDEFLAFNASWIGVSLQHLCDGGLLSTFIDWRGYPAVHAAALSSGLSPINLIVWAKNNAGMGSLYRSQHELLPLFKKGKARHVNNVELGSRGRWRSNVWQYPGASCIGSEARHGLNYHPTVKPTAMLEDALLDLSDRGEVVLDPFLGSGSTLMAAENTSRRCRGVELDASYVDVILHRFEALTGRSAHLQTTGETFAELTTRRAIEAANPNHGSSQNQVYEQAPRTRRVRRRH